jgi:hypothetical protein
MSKIFTGEISQVQHPDIVTKMYFFLKKVLKAIFHMCKRTYVYVRIRRKSRILRTNMSRDMWKAYDGNVVNTDVTQFWAWIFMVACPTHMNYYSARVLCN